MTKLGTNAPFIEKYEKALLKNAHSRAFAPLAECYRKIGMTSKALEILRQGLRHHPDYVLGLLSLAYCHVDEKKFEEAYDILAPLVEDNRDNLRLLKTFGHICLEVGEIDEALDTYKYLLFMNPRDKEIAQKVEELERDKYREYHSIGPEGKTQINHESFDIEKLDSPLPSEDKSQLFDDEGFDDWTEVGLFKEEEIEKETSWEMTRGSIEAKETSNIKEGSFASERKFVVDDSYNSEPEKSASQKEKSEDEDETPFVTHTLVDLYCSQGHFEKAVNLLKQILKLNPDDKRSADKLQEILSVTGIHGETPDQDEGHDRLMGILDKTLDESSLDHMINDAPKTKQISLSSDHKDIIEKKLQIFHQKLCDRAFNIKK